MIEVITGEGFGDGWVLLPDNPEEPSKDTWVYLPDYGKSPKKGSIPNLVDPILVIHSFKLMFESFFFFFCPLVFWLFNGFD